VGAHSKRRACRLHPAVYAREVGAVQTHPAAEFFELPKTISGEIRRVELRRLEQARASEARRPMEFWEKDV